MKSLKELLLWTESGFGANDAIIDLDRGVRWTYADLNAASRSVCASYAEGGIVKNDRVGWLAMAPGADVTALSFGARKMGAIPVGMNGRAAPEQVAWMINNVGLSALSYSGECVDLLDRLLEIGIPTVRHFIAMDKPHDDSHATLSTVYERYAGADEPTADIAPDDIALIIYTSGSTGRPKPVMHSEANWLETMMVSAFAWGSNFTDRFLNILPPHFAGWAHVTGATLRAGSAAVCLRFDPASIAASIVSEGVTQVALTPTLVRMIQEAVPDLVGFGQGNNVRTAMLGGEFANDEVLETLTRLFPRMRLLGSYGATEAVALYTGVGNPRIGSDGRLVGKPLPGVTVELRDTESGEVVTKAGRPGEMFVRGPVAVGIWGDEAATAKNFPDGWWRSGDLMERDEEGYYFIAGRSDNVFKSGAIKIQCEEVEAILKTHPSVLDVVVVPVPDTRFGYVPHAFVRSDHELTGDELEQYWRGRPDAAPYARPRHWTMWGSAPFPMVTAAKVDRHLLRGRAQEACPVG
ncbi:hypothetical protein CcI49_11380 [Frankia sp. CcI49]|uniref:class I adenylate-forming enzyme family protein n=1 Tax=Frankia sp. CcI49 TaxID=1745382 RepID=UPI000977114D|nr:class I adenylate-forming enzyme family protein [Frankia sp. CcI49]ONH60428.1 hypothetical protein CcI49_11380 [Frankia sp. CcI49]